MSTRYFMTTWRDGTVAVRSSDTRVYVKASRIGFVASFHQTQGAAVDRRASEVAPCEEVNAKTYRAVLAAIREGRL